MINENLGEKNVFLGKNILFEYCKQWWRKTFLVEGVDKGHNFYPMYDINNIYKHGYRPSLYQQTSFLKEKD